VFLDFVATAFVVPRSADRSRTANDRSIAISNRLRTPLRTP